MNLARFWTRAEGAAVTPGGQQVRTTARGWSNDSMEAARRRAREIADRVAAQIASGMPQRLQYEYGARPLPEPVVRTFADSGPEPGAVVTRNVYGALVLNASRLMFADVDRKTQPAAAGAGLGGLFSSLLGRHPKPADPLPDPVLDSFRNVIDRHSLSARIYETAAGYRLAITNLPYDAGSSETQAMLKEFGSDPLYIRLCRQQDSFRARLTPKPWRCGCSQPRVKFPFESAQDEAQYRRWEADYISKCAAYATCRYISAHGPEVIASEFAELIRYHDEQTKAASTLPLA